MKVLLVYPEVPETYWSFSHALRFYGTRANLPPLGLLTVSALLPPSWERRLVDMNVTAASDADFAWADMVFVSAMVVQKDSLERVVDRARALGKRVVVGGPYVSTSADRMPQRTTSSWARLRPRCPSSFATWSAARPGAFMRPANALP